MTKDEFRVYNDTDVSRVIEDVNDRLVGHGLCITGDGREHDGYAIYHLEATPQEIDYYETPEEIAEAYRTGRLKEDYPMLCAAIGRITQGGFLMARIPLSFIVDPDKPRPNAVVFHHGKDHVRCVLLAAEGELDVGLLVKEADEMARMLEAVGDRAVDCRLMRFAGSEDKVGEVVGEWTPSREAS